MRSLLACLLLVLAMPTPGIAQPATADPVRIVVAGLTHSHVHWILGREDRGDITIVGIHEPNRALAARYAAQHGFSMDLVHDDLAELLDAVQPEAVAAFGSIFEHLEVVEVAAPRGIHVMVEKPLAVSADHAERMAALAREHDILLLTNYETTWYPTVHAAGDLVRAGTLGPLRKVVIRDGHRGPKEIGVNDEFLEWLTDPVLNGGGALIDFGCYGAALATWLLGPPSTVTAVTQQLKPEVYPKVDDEATIVLTYPDAQAIIEASWNWPIARKDMEVYGTTGYAHALDGTRMRIQPDEDAPETLRTFEPRPAPYDDPFTFLAAAVRGSVTVPDDDLSSLPLNVMVVRILDAARTSAEAGQTITLDH